MNTSRLLQLQIDYFLDTYRIGLNFSAHIIFALAVVVILLILFRKIRQKNRFEVVELDIALCRIGKVKLKPNIEDIQMAHKIWVQLVTRKAAIEVDENDVIAEIYDSWYVLFLEVRNLISAIPVNLIKSKESTQEIIRIAVTTLNHVLRPHLTKWQARYRCWYQIAREEDKKAEPQDLQKKFPSYRELMIDMLRVNKELIAYAGELKKLIDSKSEFF